MFFRPSTPNTNCVCSKSLSSPINPEVHSELTFLGLLPFLISENFSSTILNK